MPASRDDEAFFDAEVAPLVRRALELCEARGIPMLASFEYAEGRLCNYVGFPPAGATQSLMLMAAVVYPEMFEAVDVSRVKAKA